MYLFSNICPYTATDHQDCVEIFLSNTPQYFSAEELDGLETWLHGRDESRLAYKNTIAEQFYVVPYNNRVVACGGFYIPIATGVANLVWGMVHSDFHKRGVGTQLLHHRLHTIKEQYPQHRITLDTTQHTYHFFEKQGFSVAQIQRDYYDKDLDRYDMVR